MRVGTELSATHALLAFLFAYACSLLFLYRADPRFSLNYKKAPSFEHLLLTSTIGTSVLLGLLVAFNVFSGNDLVTVFGFDRMSMGTHDVLWGFVSGAGLVPLLLSVDAFVSAFRRKFLRGSETRRERELKKIVFGSMPSSQKQIFTLLSIASLKAAFFEEVIFRGYLLGNLLLLFSPSVSITAQALLFFVAHLYQGGYNAITPFTLGTILGLVFYMAGSLTAVMIAHFVADMILLSIQAIAIRKVGLPTVGLGGSEPVPSSRASRSAEVLGLGRDTVVLSRLHVSLS